MQEKESNIAPKQDNDTDMAPKQDDVMNIVPKRDKEIDIVLKQDKEIDIVPKQDKDSNVAPQQDKKTNTSAEPVKESNPTIQQDNQAKTAPQSEVANVVTQQDRVVNNVPEEKQAKVAAQQDQQLNAIPSTDSNHSAAQQDKDHDMKKATSKSTPLKKTLMQGNRPLYVAAVVLSAGSLLLGYTVGHRQGLTVVGYDADAEQLVEVVQKQKNTLTALNKSLNVAVQERDVAVNNSNELFDALNKVKSEKIQVDGMSSIYREILRQRGGLSLTVQNIAVKPLPENAFEYQLDLIQVSPNQQRATGNVELRLISGTEVLVIPMENRSFSFADFERLTGRWTMPKGFNPQYIEVRLNGATPVIKRFGWQRGKSVENLASFAAEVPQAEANVQ